ncbi:MAG: hypothetical protein V1827_03860 [Candidatus Micrarchaeota archaeon]
MAKRAKNPTLKRLGHISGKRSIDPAEWASMRDELRMVCSDAAREDEAPLVLALMEACKGRSVMPEGGRAGKRKRAPANR